MEIPLPRHKAFDLSYLLRVYELLIFYGSCSEMPLPMLVRTSGPVVRIENHPHVELTGWIHWHGNAGRTAWRDDFDRPGWGRCGLRDALHAPEVWVKAKLVI